VTATHGFQVVLEDGVLHVDGRCYPLGDGGHEAWLNLYEALARELGLRRPLSREAPSTRPADPRLTAVLTTPVSPAIPYGYGDPCVVAVGAGDYRLLVTSNDAPDAFPILASSDLVHWRHTGFVFPRGEAPAWALTGPDSDFWAPEMHRVGEEWWICFTAREAGGELAIGLARGASPDGPFTPDAAPIVRGGVIDSHILVDAAGAPWLVWKKDDNDVWPGLLADLLRHRPGAIETLFHTEADRRTAAFAAALHPWLAARPPMQRFFALQPLIEAVAQDLVGFDLQLRALGDPRVAAIHQALRTRIFIQRLTPDGRALLGAPKAILANDLPWEGHLIEGVWITRADGRYYLFYAGNDFSTARYGVGVAVADAPDGPYAKSPEAFLSSGRDWWGPGHPSVVRTGDGWRMFLHAFAPEEAGYKRFRALLSAPIRFRDGEVHLG
jgi:hypothetical protein